MASSSSPLDPISGPLYFLGFFGGFPLVPVTDNPSDWDWDNCSSFKKNGFRYVWCYIVHLLGLALSLTLASIFMLQDVELEEFLGLKSVQDFGLSRISVLVFGFVLIYLVLATFLNIKALNNSVTKLSNICFMSTQISPNFIHSKDLQQIGRTNKRRVLGMVFLNLIFSGTLGFLSMTLSFFETMNIGRLIGSGSCFAFLFAFFAFSMPAISTYLIVLQSVDVTRSMLKNYHTEILPQSKNGRLIRSNQISPPPPYVSREGSIAAVANVAKASQAIMTKSIESIHDIETMVEYGNDIIDIAEQFNEAFGSVLILDVSTSIINCILGAYIFVSTLLTILHQLNHWLTIVIGLAGLALALLFLWKFKVLVNQTSKLELELEKTSMVLREVSILKFAKMNASQMYELSALRDKIEGLIRHGVLTPKGYFRLCNGLLSTVISTVIGYLLILMGYREKELENIILKACNTTNNFTATE